MYPEDYEVKCERLIRQWIAEDFGRSCTTVVDQYKFGASIFSLTVDGKVGGCRVHDSIHGMILGKLKDTGFSHDIAEHNQLVSSGSIERSHMPKEISKLRKLHHLLANRISSNSLKDSLGGMASLEKI
ncbi:unnamed protein product [Sphenostylis stenocarpa]|uniref:Disease resistance protein winged helix domain-containing protein n=1 Tax=Sphenostylis stenocarpa TaxID=92480 RepID=A0AA86SL26_9FABA|nr:unnamed protein product [Sphenostylis stenocarpa]